MIDHCQKKTFLLVWKTGQILQFVIKASNMWFSVNAANADSHINSNDSFLCKVNNLIVFIINSNKWLCIYKKKKKTINDLFIIDDKI